MQEGRQIVSVVLIADRTNKLPIQRKMLELRNIGIPPQVIARNRHPVPIIFVAKFIIDQAITKDTIHILDHTRIISQYIRIAYASQHDERDSTNTFDSLNSLYFDIIGEMLAHGHPHYTNMHLLHQCTCRSRSYHLIVTCKQTQIGAKKQRRSHYVRNSCNINRPILSRYSGWR